MAAAEAVRVALLARPGAARERLRAVAEQAGVALVLEGDPLELDSPAVAAAAAQVLLVALEPAVEDALERFDELLFDPGIDVIYEEAALAASREGWEVARWQRHLAAKLLRHGDVLPPGHEPEDDPAAAVSPPASAPEPDPAPAADPGLASGFDPVLAETWSDGPAAPAATLAIEPFVPEGREAVADPGSEVAVTAFDPVAAEGWGAGTDAGPGSAADVSGPVAAEPEPPLVAASDPVPASTSGRPAGFGELSLDDGGADAPGPELEAEAKSRFDRDLAALEQRIAGLSLVDDAPPAAEPAGAVLVLAGIGGPDAVRQLLGALPVGFPRPLLVGQRLEGGRYDKLVVQMQRATGLPVLLAEAGQQAGAGHVYILPPGTGVAADGTGLRFDSGGDVLAVLPPADSAVLLLSGADPEVVDRIMNNAWGGALVAGQAAEGCYDPGAANALVARGGQSAAPAELAALLVERWAS